MQVASVPPMQVASVLTIECSLCKLSCSKCLFFYPLRFLIMSMLFVSVSPPFSLYLHVPKKVKKNTKETPILNPVNKPITLWRMNLRLPLECYAWFFSSTPQVVSPKETVVNQRTCISQRNHKRNHKQFPDKMRKVEES